MEKYVLSKKEQGAFSYPGYEKVISLNIRAIGDGWSLEERSGTKGGTLTIAPPVRCANEADAIKALHARISTALVDGYNSAAPSVERMGDLAALARATLHAKELAYQSSPAALERKNSAAIAHGMLPDKIAWIERETVPFMTAVAGHVLIHAGDTGSVLPDTWCGVCEDGSDSSKFWRVGQANGERSFAVLNAKSYESAIEEDKSLSDSVAKDDTSKSAAFQFINVSICASLSHNGRDISSVVPPIETVLDANKPLLAQARQEVADYRDRIEKIKGHGYLISGDPSVTVHTVDGRHLSLSDWEKQNNAVVGAVEVGEHYGPIKSISGNVVVQSVGQGRTVTHDARNLDIVPLAGQGAGVKYSRDGKASVTVVNEQGQDRGR